MRKTKGAPKGSSARGATPSPHLKAEDLTRKRVHEAFLEALLSGKFTVPTPIEEMVEVCPAVWKRAVRVFGGNEAEAREWMDSHSPLLGGELPLLATLRVGGSRTVLRALARLDQQCRRKRATQVERRQKPPSR